MPKKNQKKPPLKNYFINGNYSAIINNKKFPGKAKILAKAMSEISRTAKPFDLIKTEVINVLTKDNELRLEIESIKLHHAPNLTRLKHGVSWLIDRHYIKTGQYKNGNTFSDVTKEWQDIRASVGFFMTACSLFVAACSMLTLGLSWQNIIPLIFRLFTLFIAPILVSLVTQFTNISPLLLETGLLASQAIISPLTIISTGLTFSLSCLTQYSENRYEKFLPPWLKKLLYLAIIFITDMAVTVNFTTASAEENPLALNTSPTPAPYRTQNGLSPCIIKPASTCTTLLPELYILHGNLEKARLIIHAETNFDPTINHAFWEWVERYFSHSQNNVHVLVEGLKNQGNGSCSHANPFPGAPDLLDCVPAINGNFSALSQIPGFTYSGFEPGSQAELSKQIHETFYRSLYALWNAAVAWKEACPAISERTDRVIDLLTKTLQNKMIFKDFYQYQIFINELSSHLKQPLSENSTTSCISQHKKINFAWGTTRDMLAQSTSGPIGGAISIHCVPIHYMPIPFAGKHQRTKAFLSDAHKILRHSPASTVITALGAHHVLKEDMLQANPKLPGANYLYEEVSSICEKYGCLIVGNLKKAYAMLWERSKEQFSQYGTQHTGYVDTYSAQQCARQSRNPFK